MNVSQLSSPLVKVLLIAWLCALLPQLGGAQTFKPLSSTVGVQASDTILFAGLQAFVTKNGTNGNAEVLPLPNSIGRVIRYTPNPGFIGMDTVVLKLEFTNSFPFITYQAYKISVFPSYLVTQSDYAITTIGNPIVVPVLANDATSVPPLSVTSLPISNHGVATIQSNGSVQFTPNAGFTGVANLNYVVCDAAGNCKTEALSISVVENLDVEDIQLQFATAKNTPLKIPLLFSGYTLFSAPTKGSVVLPTSHSFVYTPSKDSIGSDNFTLMQVSNQDTAFAFVNISILNSPSPNKMAIDDYLFTPVNTPIVFNVRENDVNGTTSNSITVNGTILPPNFPGTLVHPYNNVNGQFLFTPNQDFTGSVDFKYFVGNNFPGGGNLESANVSILVDNLAPANATFHLTTSLETPLVLNYNLPFIGYDFSIPDNGDHGTMAVHLGYQTITVNGQTVSGYNLLVYTPDAGYIGEDELEVQYCVNGTNQCNTIKIVIDIVNQGGNCVDDCVWAGDVNYDGVVNHRDLLPIGFFMGMAGNVRPNSNLEWYAQHCDNWVSPFSGFPVNLKHADADGNGLVSVEDTAALHRFYGKTHSIFPAIPPKFKGDNGIKTNLKLLSHPTAQAVQPGDLVEIELAVGTSAKPIVNLYGFVQQILINSNWVISGLDMEFYSNSWFNQNAPTIGFAKSPKANVLEMAYTRTNGLAQSGHGKFAKFDFVVEDILQGGKPGDNEMLTIQVSGGEGMDGFGAPVPLADATLEIPIRPVDASIENYQTVQAADLLVFPNPTSDLAIFHLNGNNEINELRVMNITGALVWESGKVNWKRAEVSVSDLPNGTYFAIANTSGGRVTKKFQVIK